MTPACARLIFVTERGPRVEAVIRAIDEQIQKLEAAKRLLLSSRPGSQSTEQAASGTAAPVKRGRGRPRKYPLPVRAEEADGGSPLNGVGTAEQRAS